MLEADAIGAAATARSLGIGREDFDASFRDTAAAYGLRDARSLWQQMRRASLEFPAAIRRLGAKVDLAPSDLVTFARRDPESVRRLLRGLGPDDTPDYPRRAVETVMQLDR